MGGSRARPFASGNCRATASVAALTQRQAVRLPYKRGSRASETRCVPKLELGNEERPASVAAWPWSQHHIAHVTHGADAAVGEGIGLVAAEDQEIAGVNLVAAIPCLHYQETFDHQKHLVPVSGIRLRGI